MANFDRNGVAGEEEGYAIDKGDHDDALQQFGTDKRNKNRRSFEFFYLII